MSFEARLEANVAARSCADALIALRPDWAPHVRIDKDVVGLEWVEVFFFNEEAVGPLTVEFDLDEITIHISDYHRHLYFGGENGPLARAEASRIVDDILADRLLVASAFRGEEWLGSGLIEKHAAKQLKRAENADCKLWLQSWSGFDDRTVPAIQQGLKPLFDVGPVSMLDLSTLYTGWGDAE